MTAYHTIWAIIEAFFVFYHIKKATTFLEWNSLFVAFWVWCLFDSINKLGMFK